MKLELTQKLQQQQILAPQMILSMDILLLASQDLQQRIEKEFAENPALELVEPQLKERKSELPSAPVDSSPFEKVDHLAKQSDSSFDMSFRRRKSSSDDKYEALQNTEGRPPGLRDHLTQQLRLLSLEQNIQRVAVELVNNIDTRGYLVAKPEELYHSLAQSCSGEEFQAALRAVRSLEPAGVGAENLQQCLLLQLARDQQEYPLETELILNHLEDLGENKIPKVAKELKSTIDDIQDALEIIRCLDPRPGLKYEPAATMYVRPDVIVEIDENGELLVTIESSNLPQLNVSESCKRLLKAKEQPDVKKFVRKKIESAQWLIQAIQQRQRTLQDIAAALVDYQREFMTKGPEHLRAMKMQTIADLVNVHISTVSRAIKGKYAQTPWGVYELRYFFTGGVGNSDGEVESRRNIYRKISEIIDNENKSRPLSDSAIAKILQEKGFSIARRTVTKYREQEKIPSSRLRKKYVEKSSI